MKRIATLYPVLFLLLTLAAIAQPQVSYIVPDIGAVGMNTYVEIIGPTATTGNFGTDGLYLNQPGDAVRVYPATMSDTAFVLIGPVVVSWNGRMISTQIFVRPGAPNQTINLLVDRGGSQSNLFTFDIVTPQTIPALSGGGTLGSGGTMGTRSKRGAMIVNGLTINSGAYSVSTADPDNLTNGNQGYLPFVLISKGPITIASGASLNVNASNQNGGPGGGGGAGKTLDAITAGAGFTDGGEGYTGGGEGSFNPFLGGTKQFRSPGISSGSSNTPLNGASLNGAPGGGSRRPACAEDAGGGTGHPFGTGGAGWCGETTNPNGGYGGGSGGGQLAIGGGGGYATPGGNASGAGTSGGRVHGNSMGVPMAGGSGGASGNPQGASVTSGFGGGGGGVISLYSMSTLQASGSVDARGANGGASSATGQPNGGSGSGGMVILGGKTLATTVGASSVNITGGAASSGLGAGGGGRARFDGPTNPAFPSQGSSYQGPTIDTLTYVTSRTFTLSGSFAGGSIPGISLRIYMKSDNSPGWTQLGAPGTTNNRWSLSFTAAAGAGNYYFVAMQSTPSNRTGQFDAEPQWVLSQAAANVVKVQLLPKINTDKNVDNFADIKCETERVDSVKVWNSGDDILRITQVSLARNDQFFTILPPHNAPFTLAKDSSVYIKIRYAPSSPGTRSDTLLLVNNDPTRNPAKVTLIGKKLNINPFFSQTEFDFGDVCIDSTVVRSIWFHYQGDIQASLDGVARFATGTTSFTLLPVAGLPRPVNNNDSVELKVSFTPTAGGGYTDEYEATVGPCGQKVRFIVKARGVKTAVAVNPDPLAIGDVRIGTPRLVPFSVINTGTIAGTIRKVYLTPADPAFAITGDPTGTPLIPTQSQSGQLTFTPGAAQSYAVQLCVVIDGLCPDTTCIPVTGRGVTSLLLLSRSEDTITADKCFDAPPTATDTIKLYNLGTASARIDGITAANGLVGTTALPGIPTDLKPNDSILVTITWNATQTGTFRDTLRITTQSEDPKQRLLLLPLTLVHDRVSTAVLKGDASPIPSEVDLGDIYECMLPLKYDMLLKNNGTVPDTLVASLASGTAFTLSPAVLPYAVDAGASKPVSVTFTSTTQGVYRDTLRLKSTVCPNDSFMIPFVATYYVLLNDAPEVNFGNKNVGFPAVKTATVTNTSTTPNNVRMRIDSMRVVPGDGTFTIGTPVPTFPHEVAPGETFSQNVVFTPPSEADFTGELWLFVGGPCPDTIKVPLRGKGIQSNVLVQPGALNFGTKYVCQDDSVLVVTVKNIGKAPFNITGAGIDGQDKIAFEITRSPQPLPLQPKQEDTIIVRFRPSLASADGLLRATLKITTDDNTGPEITIDLVGERRRQVLTTPNNLDFGRVEVGESDTMLVTLENRTTDSLMLDDLSIAPPFELLDQPTPILIPPLDSIKVRVRFSPTDSTKQETPLVAAESRPCVDTTRLIVKGQGKITPVGTVEIVIPLDLKGKPGDRVAIPIVMTKAAALAETGVTTFEAKIHFNRTLLIPIGARSKGEKVKKGTVGSAVQTGSILDTSTVGDQKVVRIRITNVPMILEPDTLGFIDALVMLGDAASTPVVIDTLYWTDGLVKGTKRDGLFSLDSICLDGTTRLVRATNEFGIKLAVPNPFNPSTEIYFETVEQGPTTLAIYDAYGRVVQTLIDREDLAVAEHRVTWSAPEASSGIYYAVLITPTQRSVHTLLLVK